MIVLNEIQVVKMKQWIKIHNVNTFSFEPFLWLNYNQSNAPNAF